MERALARTAFAFAQLGCRQPTESIKYQSSEVVALTRLAILEAHRMPELGDVIVMGFTRNVTALGAILAAWQRGVRPPMLSGKRQDTARIFIGLAHGIPHIRAVGGKPLPCKELTEYVTTAVELFLGGCGYPFPSP